MSWRFWRKRWLNQWINQLMTKVFVEQNSPGYTGSLKLYIYIFLYMDCSSLDADCVKNWSYFVLVWVTFVTCSEILPFVSFDNFAARVFILHQFPPKKKIWGPPGAPKSQQEPKNFLKLFLNLADSGWLWMTLDDFWCLWLTLAVSQSHQKSTRVGQSQPESARICHI